MSLTVQCVTCALCVQGWLHSILYVLFENAMSVVKLWAVIAGEPTACTVVSSVYMSVCISSLLSYPHVHAWRL